MVARAEAIKEQAFLKIAYNRKRKINRNGEEIT